ncbi:DUF4902 domain-containing protein [Massilia forsythiae]|uniref:DUF4902 domain-containing protein n=1 Tax=Massilia forsythiae TaxID=2728020 RepID=A0A7Z2VY23_9BURK|nr:DUF4902 domain-containing protein [Massilia forsythiae]QJE01532.1 DUF4902 domain-containing protein [Massilia forsythiae]
MNTLPMFLTSVDGYIRLTQAQLVRIELVHLFSGFDDPDSATDDIVTGYTEWVSVMNSKGSAISVGWDWQLRRLGGVPNLARISNPRSNLMLQDSSIIDLGQFKTEIILASFVDALDWKDNTLLHVMLGCTAPVHQPH